MTSKKLRVASASDAPAPPMSVSDAVQIGSRVSELGAIRAVLARALDDPGTNPTALAAISNRLLEIGRDLEALKAQEADQAREAAKQNVVTDRKWRPEAI